MIRRFLWLSFVLALGSFPHRTSGIDLELRAEHTQTRSDTLQGSVASDVPIVGELNLRLGARMSLAALDFERLTYFVEPRWDLFSALEFSLRAFHTVRWRDTSATSGLLAFAKLHGEFPKIIGASFGAGRLRRWHTLSDAAIVPLPRRESFHENDWAAEIRLWVHLAEHTRLSGTIATDDRYEAYNLNFPFAELALQWGEDSAPVEFFARTQLALGFGRPTGWSVGIRWTDWDLSRF